MSESAVETAAEVSDLQAEQMLSQAVAEPDEAEAQKQAESQSQGEPDKGDAKTVDWAAEAAKWKSMARKHETTAKQNADAAKKYAEYEDSQKSEHQRLTERLETAERERDEERRGRARLMAAATYSLPATLLDRIGGSSEEEINESAQALAQELEAEVARRLAAMPPAPEPARAAPSTSRPVEALTPGAMPANQQPVDGNDFLRRMAGRT